MGKLSRSHLSTQAAVASITLDQTDGTKMTRPKRGKELKIDHQWMWHRGRCI